MPFRQADTRKMSSRNELISKAEFGRRLHISTTRMKKLVADGLPLQSGKVPVARATAWVEGNIDPRRRNHWNGGGNGNGASLNELRRQREVLRIETDRLTLQKASNEVVERAVVRAFLTERAAMERDDWLAWASAASARLAATLGVDTGKLFALLEAEVRDQLRRLAGRALEGSNDLAG